MSIFKVETMLGQGEGGRGDVALSSRNADLPNTWMRAAGGV